MRDSPLGVRRQLLQPREQVLVDLLRVGPHEPVVAAVNFHGPLRAEALVGRDLHVRNADVVLRRGAHEHRLLDGIGRLWHGWRDRSEMRAWTVV
jgi:hypothetical protein